MKLTSISEGLLRYLILFFFIYSVIYIFPFPLNGFVHIYFFEEFFNQNTWHIIVPWFSDNVLNNTDPVYIRPTGSGDTLFDFVRCLLVGIFSLALATLIFFIFRSKLNYRKLVYIGGQYVRYYLIFVLLTYGIIKIFKLQFGEPYLIRLVTPLGEMSPMGLAWNYMGFSKTYTVFAGWSETIAAILLMFKRTRTLGAVVGFGVMLNVFMMNISYDIPVKLFSLHLCVFSAFLILIDGRRMLNVFVLNRDVSKYKFVSPFSKKWKNYTLQIVKFLVLILIVYLNLINAMRSQYLYGDLGPKHKLYGIYELNEFALNHTKRPALLNDSVRFRRLIFDSPNRVYIQKMNNEGIYYQTETDTIAQKIYLKEQDSTKVGVLHYKNEAESDADVFEFEGIFKNDSVYFKTERKGREDFLLNNRGFHWISEYPFNR